MWSGVGSIVCATIRLFGRFIRSVFHSVFPFIHSSVALSCTWHTTGAPVNEVCCWETISLECVLEFSAIELLLLVLFLPTATTSPCAAPRRRTNSGRMLMKYCSGKLLTGIIAWCA